MDSFIPPGYFLPWDPQLVWLYLFVIANSLMALSYYSIPAALLVLFIKRRDLVFSWMFLLFAAFIFACGTTHLMKIWTIWNSDYWFEVIIDTGTGVLSAATAVLLWMLIPKALVLPSIAQMEATNNALNEQIAHRKKAEQKFRVLLESAPDAMVIVNQEGKMVLVNSQTEKIFGYKKIELLGHPMEMLIPERFQDENPEHRAQFYKDPHVGLIGAGYEMYALRKDGTKFPVEISFSPMDTEEGILISSAIRDITERKRLQEELTRSNAELQQFAYVAAHDLREPLRTIVSYTNLLTEENKGKFNQNTQENMDFIVDAGKRMQQLISDLLTYSRVETQAKEFALTSCDAVFDQTVADLKMTIKELNGKVSRDTLPTLMSDASQLSQLFSNLIINALKFRGQQPPQIHVSAYQDGSEWVFSVKDNGIGIDIKFADRIFRMFQRLHGVGEYSGTGIGLAVCKRIVERHGGRIWFESTPGKGSVFFFTIPIRNE